MTLELNKIKRSMHADVISSFWSMLQELESKADDALLRHQVECWYRQWNRMTGDTKIAVWHRVAGLPPASTNSLGVQSST